MFGPIRSVVFDFDGTLVNSMVSIITGLGEAVRFATGKTVGAAELVASFGPAPREVLLRWIGEEHEDKVQSAYQFWLDFEKNLGPHDFPPFPGVEKMLGELKSAGIQMGIFTGRDRAGWLRIANAQNWMGKYFKPEWAVAGDDGFSPKPNPEGLVHLQKVMGFNPAETLMVGDHVYDVRAGRSAGMKSAAALWDLPPGQGTKRSRFRDGWTKWDNEDCDVRLDTPESLTRWLRDLGTKK